LKIASEYMGCPVEPSSVAPLESDTVVARDTGVDVSGENPQALNPQQISGMNSGSKKNKPGIVLGYHMRQK
jgi:hypothetical protein